MEIVIISTSAIVVPPEDYSGSELMVTHLVRGLRDKHDVTLVAPEGSHIDGVNIIETIPPTYGGLEGERKAFEIYKDKIPKDADIYDDNSHFCVASELNLQNHIFSCHDLLPLRKAPNVDLILARSKFHAEYLRKAWNRDSIKFVHNGIDLQHYEYREDKENFCLFLGRMTRAKGPLAFCKICRETGMKGVLAGEDSPRRGVESETVRQVIRECNANKKLTYLGRVPEWKKVELLRDARAYISPLTGNYLPVFDLVNIESLASGTPVFSVKKGAIPELLGGLGLTNVGYVAKDSDELTDVLRRFERDEFEFRSGDCRKRAERFSKEEMVLNYETKYRSLAKIS